MQAKDKFFEKINLLTLVITLCLSHNLYAESIYNKIFDYTDLDELSGLIANLDLVVAVNHIVAHVAGALNVNTILMLPCVPNWRWEITHRHTSPWYKSVTIYRQETPGDWGSVVKKVKEKIQGKNYV